jgi:hypothetical protein
MNQLTHRIMVSVMFSMVFLSVAHAELLSDEKWSFDFNNVSILDAFNKIEKETGIELVVRKETSEPVMITYCNKNQSILQVCRDLLRNVNHVLSLNYSNDGKLESINIIIIGQGDRNGRTPISNNVNQLSEAIGEQIKTKDKLVKQPDSIIPAAISVHKNMKPNLPKPPVAPNIPGWASPPSPPGR